MPFLGGGGVKVGRGGGAEAEAEAEAEVWVSLPAPSPLFSLPSPFPLLSPLPKVPDVHDNIRYDLEHNAQRLPLRRMNELYTVTKNFADAYVGSPHLVR